MLSVNKVFTILLLTFTSAVSVASQTMTQNQDTKLINWSLIEHGLHLQLIQRTPDQTRGFFLGRGFSNAVTNDIATQCVFQTIVRNTDKYSGKAITLPLPTWVVHYQNKSQPIKLKEKWDSQWSTSEVAMASRLAFRWATFPTQQTFEPSGDRNWGMISMGLPPGASFDLTVKWQHGDQNHSATIKAMQCPADGQNAK